MSSSPVTCIEERGRDFQRFVYASSKLANVMFCVYDEVLQLNTLVLSYQKYLQLFILRFFLTIQVTMGSIIVDNDNFFSS